MANRSRASSIGRPSHPTLHQAFEAQALPPPALPAGPQTPGLNKLTPNNSMSLYQKCILIRERWARVHGFQESFLDPDAPFAPESDYNVPTDPVSIVLSCLRLGSSLCFLFNALELDRKLDVNADARPSNVSACKRCAAHFLMAAKKELNWGDEDLFTITQLYDTNTTGMVKVRRSVVLRRASKARVHAKNHTADAAFLHWLARWQTASSSC